jgi:CBS domain-containing protein
MMLLLSELGRFRIVDKKKQEARLFDFSAARLDGEYPLVTSLMFTRADGKIGSLPWKALMEIRKADRIISVEDLDAGQEPDEETLRNEVLLLRDVQDALVLDLLNRRATRVNDLVLEYVDGQLRLNSVDSSLLSILRRISRGNFGGAPTEDSLSDWKYIEFLRGDPRAVPKGPMRDLRITRLPPGEIATLTNFLPYLHAAELLILLPDPQAADTLELMAPERQVQVFEELEEDQALTFLNLMAPDSATSLIRNLNPELAARILLRLDEVQQRRVVELLRYPADTVGGIMTNDMVYVESRLSAAEARKLLRKRLKGPDFVDLIYVVEDDDTLELLGVVSLRNLIIADDEIRLEELMDPYLSTLAPLDLARGAAYRLVSSHLAAMPVVGKKGQLVGVVTVDAAVSQIAPAAWGDQAPRIFS